MLLASTQYICLYTYIYHIYIYIYTHTHTHRDTPTHTHTHTVYMTIYTLWGFKGEIFPNHTVAVYILMFLFTRQNNHCYLLYFAQDFVADNKITISNLCYCNDDLIFSAWLIPTCVLKIVNLVLIWKHEQENLTVENSFKLCQISFILPDYGVLIISTKNRIT